MVPVTKRSLNARPAVPMSELLFAEGVMVPVRVRPLGERVLEAALVFVETLKEVEAKYERKPREREPRSPAFAEDGRMPPVKVRPEGERVEEAAERLVETLNEVEAKMLRQPRERLPRSSVFAASEIREVLMATPERFESAVLAPATIQVSEASRKQPSMSEMPLAKVEVVVEEAAKAPPKFAAPP